MFVNLQFKPTLPLQNTTFSKFEGGSMIVQGYLGLLNTILRINENDVRINDIGTNDVRSMVQD